MHTPDTDTGIFKEVNTITNKRGGDRKSHEQGAKTVKEKYGNDFYKRIGQKGGKSQGKENNPGNFANRDPEDVKKSGRLGGLS